LFDGDYCSLQGISQMMPTATLGSRFRGDDEGDAFAPELGADWEFLARRSLQSTQGIGLSFSTWRSKR